MGRSASGTARGPIQPSGHRRASRLAQPALWLASVVPLGHLALLGATDRLGANPIEAITHATGDWTLRLLLATLAVTPLRRLTGWNGVIRFRRTLGLAAFLYASLHLLTYLWLDQFFDLGAIVKDVGRRRFIAAGAAAFLLLVPLALTSTAGMIRRLGGRAWRRLHRLVYVAASLGVLHYWWLVKADTRRPLVYAAVIMVLLGARVVRRPGALLARGMSRASLPAGRRERTGDSRPAGEARGSVPPSTWR